MWTCWGALDAYQALVPFWSVMSINIWLLFIHHSTSAGRHLALLIVHGTVLLELCLRLHCVGSRYKIGHRTFKSAHDPAFTEALGMEPSGSP